MIESPKLHRLNIMLASAVALLGLYIVVMPWLPLLRYQQESATKQPSLAAEVEDTSKVRAEDYLLIPSAVIDQPILEGTSDSTVNDGPWRRPFSSTPDKGSNTVIVGHRFTYSPSVKDSFYNLDKVALGDDLLVYWKGKRYHYIVNEIKTVDPSAVEIEAPTDDTRLTLYTCTPLWSSSHRLVVIGQLQEETP